MDDYAQAMEIVRAHPELASFCGPRDPVLVGEAQRALGVQFPLPYRRFVAEVGAGSFGSFEVLGVVDADWENSAVPDGVWYTLSEREDGMPENLLVVGEVGDGSLYCLAVGDAGAPVVVLEPGSGAAAEVVFDDFGAFLLEGMQRALDR